MTSDQLGQLTADEFAALLPRLSAHQRAALLDAERRNGQALVEGAAPRFRGIGLVELRQRPRPSYVVDGYLQADSVAVLEGLDGTYKTFLALAWAHCVALGRDWFGRPVRQGRVLYLLGEGSRGLPKRADAWQIVHLHERQDVPDLVFVVDEMPQLWKGDASAVIAANPGPFVLVVTDTLARAMVGGNENLQQDMGLYVDGCDQLRRAYEGACVLNLRHLNASGSTRGSSALPGAIATKLRLEREGSSRVVTLSVRKQRDDEPLLPVQLTARSVELSTLDDRGRAETSLVLDAETRAGTGAGSKEAIRPRSGPPSSVLSTPCRPSIRPSPGRASATGGRPRGRPNRPSRTPVQV